LWPQREFFLVTHQEGYSDLHTLLDTSMFLLSGMLTLLLWGAGERLGEHIPSMSRDQLHGYQRAGIPTRPGRNRVVRFRGRQSRRRAMCCVQRLFRLPPTYCRSVSPAPSGCNDVGRHRVLGFAVALVLLGAALLGASYWLPRYSAPLWLGITRPTLIPVPLLWAAVAASCWRLRSSERLYATLALMATVLVLANVAMLYSRDLTTHPQCWRISAGSART